MVVEQLLVLCMTEICSRSISSAQLVALNLFETPVRVLLLRISRLQTSSWSLPWCNDDLEIVIVSANGPPKALLLWVI